MEQIREWGWRRERSEVPESLGARRADRFVEHHALDLERGLRAQAAVGKGVDHSREQPARAHRQLVAVDVDVVDDHVRGAGPIGRRDECREVGALVDVAERVAPPLVPPRQERCAAHVVTEREYQ